MSQPALRLVEFSLALATPEGRRPVLQRCNFELAAGGFYLVVGRSGSGKSTLLRWLTGLFDPRDNRAIVSGTCAVLGLRIDRTYPRALRGRVAAVLQDEGLLDDLSPRENVELALTAARRSTKLAVGLLNQVGLRELPARVSALSGGMRKRAGVARGLAAEPELFLFDEPTAGLDGPAGRQLATLLRDTHRDAARPRTTLVITHDLQAFADLADKVVEIDDASHTLRLRSPDDPGLHAEPHLPRPGVVAHRAEDPVLAAVGRSIGELGSLTHTLLTSVLHLPPVYPVLCVRTVWRCLIESAFFAGLGTLLLGFLTTFFALRNSPLEGAFEDQILIGVGKVLVGVLAPLMSGFFFTARIAAGAAARLGTMKRSNQVSALMLMGVRPADYLLTPLTYGFVLALPLVTLGAIVLATLASAAAAGLVSDVTMVRFCAAFFHSTGLPDLRAVLAKAVLSGYLVSVSTYHLAMGPKRSGQDVGDAVNQSIVVGMLTTLLVHGLFTVWQFT